MGTVFTPPMWGGGPDAALPLLTQVEVLFKSDHPAKGMHYARLGIVHQNLGHVEESRRAYQEALRLEPGLVWVKDRLRPGLEKGIPPFP